MCAYVFLCVRVIEGDEGPEKDGQAEAHTLTHTHTQARERKRSDIRTRARAWKTCT